MTTRTVEDNRHIQRLHKHGFSRVDLRRVFKLSKGQLKRVLHKDYSKFPPGKPRA